MSLLDAIDGASLVIVDPDQQLAYAWFGGAGVNVYDNAGNEVHYFTIGGVSKVTASSARAAIARMIEYSRSETD
jgi:hypothetical protein